MADDPELFHIQLRQVIEQLSAKLSPCSPRSLYSVETKVAANGQISSQEGLLFYAQTLISPASFTDLIFKPVIVPAGYRLILHAIDTQTNDDPHNVGTYTGYPGFFVYMAGQGASINLAALTVAPNPPIIPACPAILLLSTFQEVVAVGSTLSSQSLVTGGRIPYCVIPGGFAIYAVAQQVTSGAFAQMTLFGLLVKDATIEENRGDY
jgi:hypothetical protein